MPFCSSWERVRRRQPRRKKNNPTDPFRESRLMDGGQIEGLTVYRAWGGRCIKQRMCNSNAPCTNSSAGAQCRSKRDRRRRHGGGERRLNCAVCSNRCQTRGATVWNCPIARPTPMAPRFFLNPSPTKRRCRGPAVFRATPSIRIPPNGFICRCDRRWRSLPRPPAAAWKSQPRVAAE